MGRAGVAIQSILASGVKLMESQTLFQICRTYDNICERHHLETILCLYIYLFIYIFYILLYPIVSLSDGA